VLVGPTPLAVAPLRLEELSLPMSSCRNAEVALKSGPRCFSYGDAQRLADARLAQAPLSFGSVVHLRFGGKQPCRPCMFERWPGRCTKSWLCDFCHCHASQKRREGPAPSVQRRSPGAKQTTARKPRGL